MDFEIVNKDYLEEMLKLSSSNSGKVLIYGCDIGLGKSMAGVTIFEKLNNGEVIIVDQQFEQRSEDIIDKFKSLELELVKPVQLALPPIKKENKKSHKRDYKFHK